MTTPSQAQFVEDYTLVIDNDARGYADHLQIAKSCDLIQVSEQLRDKFETYISEVAERERQAGCGTGALLISQLLIGWGSDTFDKIARHYIETYQETTGLKIGKEVK